MSDHWNSLADLLGTPSIDPLQRKASPPKKREKPIVESSVTPVQQAKEARPIPKEIVEAVDEPVPSATISVKAEQPSRLRSSWDTVARLFGVVTGSDPAPVEDSPKREVIAEKTSPSSSDEDLFAGFGRKPARNRAEEPPRKPSVREPSSREPSSRNPATREPVSREPVSRDSSGRGSSGRGKKPSSFWDDTPVATDDISTTARSNTSSSEYGDEEKPASSRNSNEEIPERRGRTRNIRRGRDNSPSADTPRENQDAPDTKMNRDQVRNETRNENATKRTERTERPTDSARSERAERTPNRQSSDRQPSDRQPSDRQARGSDRPARDTERKPRNEDRGAKPNDRTNRGEKRPSTMEEAPSSRNAERPPRSDSSTVSSEGRDRPSRGRAPRREPERVIEDEGDWDSSEVVFEQDEEAIDRDIPVEQSDDEDSATAVPRRRRRRRGSRSGSRSEPASREDASNDDDATGPQAYGRHASEQDLDEEDDDESESVRIHKVTSWLDAISPMIDANMENHKRNPGQDRGRGGSRSGGNSRRRGSGGSSSGSNR